MVDVGTRFIHIYYKLWEKVHASPFANITHGDLSILADTIALKLAGIKPGQPDNQYGDVITGFGANIGFVWMFFTS